MGLSSWRRQPLFAPYWTDIIVLSPTCNRILSTEEVFTFVVVVVVVVVVLNCDLY